METALASQPELSAAHNWYGVSLVCLGETEKGLAELEQALEEHSWYVGCLRVDPRFDPLRADPRFTTLLKKAGLDK